MPKDFYQVLGLSRGASADEVKRSYRRLSKELHPDKHKGDKVAEERFKSVNEAYEVLSNPEKKKMYDQFGTTGGPGSGGHGSGGFDFSGFADAGNFADIFESFFGGSRARGGAREERGADREMELSIDLPEVLSGARRKVSVSLERICKKCKGTGAEEGAQIVTCVECSGTGQISRSAQSFFGVIQQRSICSKCRGSGRVPEKPCRECGGEGRREETFELSIDIPAGIEDGQTLRVRGEGDAGRRNATAGDLYVTVRVSPHKVFVRDGVDIKNETTISVLDATLGAEIEVSTLHGSVILRVPEGTQPGQVFRLKGKGVPRLNTSRMGDHYVTVHVEVPKKLSRAERKLLEELRDIRRK